MTKFNIIAISACCFMALGNKPSCAKSPFGKEVVQARKAYLEVSEKFPTYLETKKYDDITDGQLKKEIKKICQNKCNRFNCSSGNFMQQTCERLCPKQDIKKCLHD